MINVDYTAVGRSAALTANTNMEANEECCIPQGRFLSDTNATAV